MRDLNPRSPPWQGGIHSRLDRYPILTVVMESHHHLWDIVSTLWTIKLTTDLKNKPHTIQVLDHSTGNFPYPSSPYSCIGDSVTVPECALLREGSDHCGLNSWVNKDHSYITLYLIRPSAYSIVRQYGNCFHVPWPEKESFFFS